jgi:hypothetical protein
MGSCVSDIGYVAAANAQASAIIFKASIDTAIQIGIALWERNSSLSIANMQDELADRQTILAEKIHAHAKLFWPREAALVNDIFGEGKVVTQYHGLATGWGQFSDIEIAAGRASWVEQMNARCTPVSKCEDARWQRNGQAVRADLMSYAARQDEARTQILNDRRYARQYGVLGLGKGQLRDLLSYQAIGNSIGTNASEMLISTVNSALTTYGFYSNKIDVQRWGSGTREMLGAPTATAPMGARPQLTQVAMPEAPRMTPVSPELMKAPIIGKAAEWNDLGSDLQKMNDTTGRY